MMKTDKMGRLFPTLSWQDFYQASFSFNSPFQLQLDNDTFLYAEKVLRILPKKRIVVSGWWKDKPVVAKLFFSSKNERRHLAQEVAGLNILKKNNIPSPFIYYQGKNKSGHISILILEKIEAKNFMCHLADADFATRTDSLKKIILELATQHVLGILQKDLHFKNFLYTDKHIYTIDGEAISEHPFLLRKKSSMQNLALLLSQLGVGREKEQAALFLFYAKLRGWQLKAHDELDLFYMIQLFNKERAKAFQKKLMRSCTDFEIIKKKSVSGMYDRAYLGKALLAFLEAPELLFNSPEKAILKNGNSQTVIKALLDGRYYVIKRYNIKHFFHWLRRLFRTSRAKKNWLIVQKINFFGLDTPKPVAFIERTRFGLLTSSYYICEFKESMDVRAYFFVHQQSINRVSEMVFKIISLLKKMAKLNMTHGDLKASNILIDGADRPLLIDFDGAKEHHSAFSLHASWRKEIKRLLKNFETLPTVYQLFISAIKKI